MKPISLYTLSLLPDDFDNSLLNRYLYNLSHSDVEINLKPHEFISIKKFVNFVFLTNSDIKILDNFYCCFKIPQISKEFDLLRINESFILNIETKATFTSEEKNTLQLLENQYYLSHLELPTFSYCFISDVSELYTLDRSKKLIKAKRDELLSKLEVVEKAFTDRLETKFKVSHYLTSPLNLPKKFLKKQYFLTSHQKQIKTSVITQLKRNEICQIIGGAGTGKTLLLYDIALELLKLGHKVCVIHCGLLCDGHDYINANSAIKIFPIKYSSSRNYSGYDFVLFDEAHRLFGTQLDFFLKLHLETGINLLFSLDSKQVLSNHELRMDISNKLISIPSINTHKLTNRIRTNKELAQFISAMFDLRRRDKVEKNDNIDICYTDTIASAKILIFSLAKKGYTFINYTPSQYASSEWDRLPTTLNSHRVIGQEFDKVAVLLGPEFRYTSEGVLDAKSHPNPDYLYVRLLYQGITRVRESICVVVNNNMDVFEKLINLVSK